MGGRVFYEVGAASFYEVRQFGSRGVQDGPVRPGEREDDTSRSTPWRVVCSRLSNLGFIL